MNIIRDLSNFFIIPERDIKNHIKTAPHRYKEYEIQKRKRNEKHHDIAQPAKNIKILQQRVIKNQLANLPVHNCAMAYQKGLGIKDNAEMHKKNQYLLKMDFENFFNSIVPDDLIQHVEKYKKKLKTDKLSEEDIFVLEHLFFYYGKKNKKFKMSIGAPSSPFLSNTILYDFDIKLSKLAEKEDVTYTRYADDLTLTTNKKDTLCLFPAKIKNILKEIEYPKLSINKEKTIFSSKKHNRHITGLVITNDEKISLGRKKKRKIKSLVYSFKEKKPNDKEINQLKGWLAFAKDVEPSFYETLKKKYTKRVITRIKKYKLNPNPTPSQD